MKLSTVAVNCRLLLSAPRLGPFTHSDPFGPWLEARLPLIVGVANNENRRPTASFSLDDGGSGSRFFDGNGFLSEDRGGKQKASAGVKAGNCYSFNVRRCQRGSVASLTSAQSAAQSPAVPKITQDHKFSIITLLQWERRDAWLRDAGRLGVFQDIVGGLKNGFRIGVSSPILHVSRPESHESALENSSVIVKDESVQAIILVFSLF
jgi:hypothetical protein